MKGLSEDCHLAHWETRDGFVNVEMYIHRTQASFSFPSSHMNDMRTEEELGAYLERQARNLIERYGDSRYPKPDAVISEAEQRAYQEMMG